MFCFSLYPFLTYRCIYIHVGLIVVAKFTTLRTNMAFVPGSKVTFTDEVGEDHVATIDSIDGPKHILSYTDKVSGLIMTRTVYGTDKLTKRKKQTKKSREKPKKKKKKKKDVTSGVTDEDILGQISDSDDDDTLLDQTDIGNTAQGSGDDAIEGSDGEGTDDDQQGTEENDDDMEQDGAGSVDEDGDVGEAPAGEEAADREDAGEEDVGVAVTVDAADEGVPPADEGVPPADEGVAPADDVAAENAAEPLTETAVETVVELPTESGTASAVNSVPADTTLRMVLEKRAASLAKGKAAAGKASKRRDMVYEEAWKYFNPGGKPMVKKSVFKELLRKYKVKGGGAMFENDPDRLQSALDDLFPEGAGAALSYEEFRSYGDVTPFTDDLAVFRFRALVSEKSRTARGPVDFGRAFRFFDPKASGSVDHAQCQEAIRSCGQDSYTNVSRYDVVAIMRSVCAPGEMAFGETELEAFAKSSSFTGDSLESKLRSLMDGAADVYTMFESFDADMSGFLDVDELTKALQSVVPNVGPEEVEALFSKLDCNGDGSVTLAEFLDFIRNGAFFVHIMSPTGFFHIKTDQTLSWGEFRNKVLQKLFWNSRGADGAARIKLDTVKLYKHFGRIGPVNEGDNVDDPVVKHIRAGDFLFVLNPGDLCEADEATGWVENFAFKKVKRRGAYQVPANLKEPSAKKTVARAAKDLLGCLWPTKGRRAPVERKSAAVSGKPARAERVARTRPSPRSPRSPRASPPALAVDADSSDISDAGRSSEEDAGALSDASTLAESSDEETAGVLVDGPLTRTAVMLPPALRPLPPPDHATKLEFAAVRANYSAVRRKLLASVGGKEHRFSKWLDVLGKMCMKEERRAHRRFKGFLEQFQMMSVFHECLKRAKSKDMQEALTVQDLHALVTTLGAGRVRLGQNQGSDDVSWVELVDMLRLPLLSVDVTLWTTKHVRAWVARCLEMPKAAPYFRRCDGMELLMLPIRESARKAVRQKTRKPGEKASYIEEKYNITSMMQRKKLLLEIQALLAIRRNQRQRSAEGFEVENWKKIDILDWLYHDVKLPQYADAFANAPLDGWFLLALTPQLLRSEFGVEQARHRRRIMGQLSALRHGPPKPVDVLEKKDEADDEAPSEDEEDPVAIKGAQARQLMARLRGDVELELKGFRRGTQLVDATDFDIDGTPWEAGVRPPKSPKLTGAELPESSVAQGFMADAGNAGNTVVLPRQAPVEEMVSVLRIRMKAMFKGGPNEAAGAMWDAMVGEVDQLDPEVGGIEFSVFPRAMKDSISVEVRSQLQAATLFRFLDMDKDKVISRSDMVKALARGLTLEKAAHEVDGTGPEQAAGKQGSSSAGHGQTMRHIIADKFLTSMCECMDRQQMTVRMAFTALVSRTLRGNQDSKDPEKFGALSITSREFVAFVRGMCPKSLNQEDADSVLLYIDRDADNKIGWDEFMESFVSCYGRWLMRLKQNSARLADKISMPGMKERYAEVANEIHNVQRMMAAAFRQTKASLAAQQAPLTARSSKLDDTMAMSMKKSDADLDTLREFIDRMSQIRRGKSRMVRGLETEFYRHDGVLMDGGPRDLLLSGTDDVEIEMNEIVEHAELILARHGTKEVNTMYDFLVAIYSDIQKLDDQTVSIKVASSPTRSRTPPPAYFT